MYPPLMPLAIHLILLAVIAGCASIHRPPYRAEAKQATVFAGSEEDASVAATEFEEAQAFVQERLSGLRHDVHAEVWIKPADELSDEGWDGREAAAELAQSRIIVKSQPTSERQVGLLVHELVHLLVGETWSALPLAVEEGLASILENEAAPGEAPLVIAERVAGAMAALGGETHEVAFVDSAGTWYADLHWRLEEPLPIEAILAADRERFLELSHDREIRRAMRGVGFIVAWRIVASEGTEGLRRLSMEALDRGDAQVAPNTLLAKASLEAAGDWEAAIDELTTPGVRGVVDRIQARQLGVLAAREIARRKPDLVTHPAEEVLGRTSVVLRPHQGHVRPLNTLSQFRESFTSAWNAGSWTSRGAARAAAQCQLP